MKTWNGRSWGVRIGVAALFMVFSALGGCNTGPEDLTGVGPQQSEAPQKAQMFVSADSTSDSTEDDCYLVNGQWICP